MIKWLAVNEDDMIRAVGDTRDSVMWDAECERINDIQQGFTPDEYRYIKAEYIGKANVKDIMRENDIYDERNWREA